MALKTRPFDPAKYLDTAEARAEYLTAAFETNDARYIAHALGVVGRAIGMSKVAAEADLSRENLYRALSDDGNPELTTFVKVMTALHLKLQAVPAD